MDPVFQAAMASTQQLIAELEQKRMKLEDELREVEKQARGSHPH